MSLEGGCLCGQVRYASSSDPVATAVCHCRNCQKQGGAAFSIVAVVPSASVTVTGALKTFDDQGDSGGVVHRQFCPECGSPIFSRIPTMPDVTIIKAGTLDDVSTLTPQVQVWCQSMQPWVKLNAELPQFARNPTDG
ncbi:MAG: GFA family protein [Sphingobium sp.]